MSDAVKYRCTRCLELMTYKNWRWVHDNDLDNAWYTLYSGDEDGGIDDDGCDLPKLLTAYKANE